MDTIIKTSDVIVSEDKAFVEFTLSLNTPSNLNISVDWDLDADTAGSGDMNAYAGGTLVFQPGTTTQTLRIAIDDDTREEAIESFQLELENPVNARIANERVTATIIDNEVIADSINPANLSVSDIVVDEQDGSALFYVTLDRATSAPFSVDYATQDRSAAAGSDYSATSGTLNFAPGETAKAVRVDILDDALAEPDELFDLVLSNLQGSAASQVQLADTVGTGIIGHNDIDTVSAPVISAQPVMVSEADGYVDFAIQLSAPSANAVSVDWWTDTDSAYSSDFDNLPSTYAATLVFAPGVTTQTVRVAITDDDNAESLENFALQLGNATNATLGTNSVNATIVDNDALADSITPANLSVRDVIVDESQHTATFYIELDRAVNQAFSIDYATQNLSAQAGLDYTAYSGTISFAAGDTLQAVTVEITDDTLAEGAEQFQLVLSNTSGAGAGQVALLENTATAFIGANDNTPIATPTIHTTSVVASERDGYVEFVLSLNAPSNTSVSVDWDIDSDTAGSGDMNAYAGGTLVFQPGTTTQTLRIAIDDDAREEAIESFQLELENPVNARIANERVTATIIDNEVIADSINPANLSVSDIVVDEQDGSALFYVTLDRATSAPFSVDYATQDRSAAAGSDYSATSGTLNFAPGETAKAVRVDILDDALAEPDELFDLVLSNLQGSAASQVQLADTVGTGIIGHNDIDTVSAPVISAQPVMVSEADGYVDFAIQLSAPSANAVSVDWWTDTDSAYSSDFDNLPSTYAATLVFAPGVTTQTVRVAITDDDDAESLENFALQLGNATNATLGTNSVNATIVDNDTLADSITPANLSVRDVIVDESQHTATFYIELDRAVNQAFSIDYATQNLSAQAGLDYTAHSGTISFAAGDTLQAVTVEITDDTLTEGAEQFQLVLSNTSGAGAGQVALLENTATAFIGANDNTPIATPTIHTTSVVASERDGYVEFVLSLNAPSNTSVSVDWDIDSDTAGSGDMNAYAGGTLVFQPGTTTQTLRIAIDDDAREEAIESFQLELENPVNARIANERVTATIIDNEVIADSINPANLSVSDIVVDEQDGSALFYVTLDRATSASFSVDYATQDRSAAAGSDYSATSGTLNFAPGETAKVVRVDILDDALAEPDELFDLVLSNLQGSAASQVQLADTVGTGIIGHNDIDTVSAPVISAQPVMVSEADGYVDFAIQLSAPSANAVSVDWWTDTDSAYSSDFDNLPSTYAATLVFAPGVTTQTVRVAITDDDDAESLENFALQLGNATNATLGTNSVNATIVDNDTLADSITPANLSVRDVIVDESQHTATFYIELDRAVNQAFSIDYATQNLSAQAGLDYTAHSGTISFAAGDTLQAVTVEIAQDSEAESNEQFQLLLSNPDSSYVMLGDATATATIRDSQGQTYPDDGNPTEPDLKVITFSEYGVNTENPRYEFADNVVDIIGMIVRDNAQPESPVVAANKNFLGPVYINFNNPVDHVSFDAGYFNNLGSTTIEYIGPGGQVLHSETNTDFGVISYEYRNMAGISSIHVVNSGHDDSGFSVDTVGFGNAISTDTKTATVNMKTLTVEKSEGHNGNTVFEFTVERTGDLSQEADIGWAVTTTDLNSVSANDFSGGGYPTGVVSFGANQIQQTIRVEVQGDVTEESDEYFVVNLLAPSQGTAIGVGSATATILDDDTPDAPVAISSDDDTFIVQQGVVSRAAGNDTYILSEFTTTPDSEIVISDSEGSNQLSLFEGLTITSSAATATALKMTLGNGSEITLLNANNYEYSVTQSPLSPSDSNTIMDFDQFVSEILHISGGVPVSGISEGPQVILGSGSNWSPDTAPIMEPADDTYIAQRGIVSRGEGDDIYVIADELIPDQTSVTISDSTGENTIAFENGLQIETFDVANNALRLNLANDKEITILNAGEYQFMTGGDLFTGTSGAIYSYSDFVKNVLGVSEGVPSEGIVQGGSVTIEASAIVELPIASTQTVQASPEDEIFVLDLTAARRVEDDTQLVLTGFDTSADALQINWDGERGTFSLAEVDSMASINTEYDPFTNSQVITFGMDANSDPVSLTLQGVSDPSQVSILLA